MDEKRIESVEEIEKPKRRQYVMTEARKLAFERCRAARAQQVTKIQTAKKLRSLETKEAAIISKKMELMPPEPEPEPKPDPEPPAKKPRKKRAAKPVIEEAPAQQFHILL